MRLTWYIACCVMYMHFLYVSIEFLILFYFSTHDEIIPKLVANFLPNYIWFPHRHQVKWKDLKHDQIINKFPRAVFTTKIGLLLALNPKSSGEEDCGWWKASLSSHSKRTMALAQVTSSLFFFPRCYQVETIVISIWLRRSCK